MVHANSPYKRLDWQKECWREQKKNQVAAQKGKVSATVKPGKISKSRKLPVTEKPEYHLKVTCNRKTGTPSKSGGTEKRYKVFA